MFLFLLRMLRKSGFLHLIERIILPQKYAIVLNGLELRTEMINFKMLMMKEPCKLYVFYQLFSTPIAGRITLPFKGKLGNDFPKLYPYALNVKILMQIVYLIMGVYFVDDYCCTVF